MNRTPKPTLRGVPQEVLIERLTAMDADPHREGDALRARGFCHGGDDPSTLAFYPTEDGRAWRVKCWQGSCSKPADEIVEMILAAGDLPRTVGPVAEWTARGPQSNGTRPPFFDGAQIKAVVAEHEALIHRPEIIEELTEQRRISRAVIDGEWLGWRAADGGRVTIPYASPFATDRRAVYQRDRWLPGSRRNGSEAPKVLPETGRSRWLYFPRPDLLADRWAVLCEGAMDALAVVSAGLPAIAAPSAMWKPGWNDELVKLGITRVFVAHDADDSGQAFAAKVKGALEPAVVVHAVDLGLEDGGDLTDFLRGFPTLASGGRALLRLCEDAEPKEDGLHFIDAADVRQEPQEPLLLRWGQRVPQRAVTLLLGREDTGKTTLACQLSADVSVGGLGYPPRTVLLLSHEDSSSQLASRLQAAEADMARVKILSNVVRDGRRMGFRLPRDAAYLQEAVRRFNPALVVLGGSLMSHVEAGKDSHRQTDMRAVLEPLHDVAEIFGPAVLCVVHPNKNRQADPGHSITGSTAIIESARSALLLAQEDDDPNALVLAHFKANYSPKEESLSYRRRTVELPNGINTVRLEQTGTSKLSAVELIASQLKRTAGEGRISKREQAKNLLAVLLADHEPHEVKPIKATLEAAGISESTTERAKADLGVQTSHDMSVPPIHFWTLPNPFKRSDHSPLNGADGTDLEGTVTGLENGSLEPSFATPAVQSPQAPAVEGTGRPNPFTTPPPTSRRKS